MPNTYTVTPGLSPFYGDHVISRRSQDSENWLDVIASQYFTSGTVVAAGDLISTTIGIHFPGSIVLCGYYEAAAGANLIFKVDGTQVGPTFHTAANITAFPFFVATGITAGQHTFVINGSQNSIICGLSIESRRAPSLGT